MAGRACHLFSGRAGGMHRLQCSTRRRRPFWSYQTPARLGHLSGGISGDAQAPLESRSLLGRRFPQRATPTRSSGSGEDLRHVASSAQCPGGTCRWPLHIGSPSTTHGWRRWPIRQSELAQWTRTDPKTPAGEPNASTHRVHVGGLRFMRSVPTWGQCRRCASCDHAPRSPLEGAAAAQ